MPTHPRIRHLFEAALAAIFVVCIAASVHVTWSTVFHVDGFYRCDVEWVGSDPVFGRDVGHYELVGRARGLRPDIALGRYDARWAAESARADEPTCPSVPPVPPKTN